MPRTITDIIPPSRRRPMVGESQAAPRQTEYPTAPYAPVTPPPPPAPFVIPRRRFPWGTLLFAVIIIGLVVAALYAFGGAKIEVSPTEDPVTLSASLTATPQSGDLPFETVTIEKVASTSVPAETTAAVQQSAQGTITITNTSNAAQQLITNTRFAAPNGLIFRIHQGITVPSSTATAPGQLTATVYADQPGAQYDIEPTTFTIPGLKGSAAFMAVTGKSWSAFTGGFSGQRGTVSAATDDAAHAKLQAALVSSIQSAIQAQTPNGYVLIPGAVRVTYQSQPDGVAGDNTVVISESASAIAVVFPEAALARAIAAQAVKVYGSQPVSLVDTGGLILALASTSTAANVGAGPLSFTLSGSTTILWTVDPSKIAGAVAGKSRTDARSVLSTFPEVNKAQIMLRPFWASSFPSDPSKITVVVDNPS